MKKYKLNIKKSIDRFNLVQIITVILLFGLTIFNTIMGLITSNWAFWSLIEGIELIILLLIFYILGNKQPFYIDKIKENRMYIMGDPTKRKMIKSYVSNLPLARRFKLIQLVNIQEFRKDGSLYKEVPMKNGRFHGTEKIYSQNGNLKKVRSYKQDELDGISMDLANSSIAIKKNYKEAKLHGVSKEFDEKTGNLVREIPYTNGEKHGTCKYYFPENKNLKKETEFKQGQKEGKEIIYRENQEIKEEREYKNDKLDGVLKCYYENGKIKSEAEFSEGQKDGTYTEFYQNGEVKKIIHYKNDQKHGQEITYNKDGNKISEAEYEKGKVIGEPKYFSSDGKKIN